MTTVVGPSGSGKSSLLRLLALVDRPTTGSVRIRREEVGCVGVRGRRLLRRTEIGYLFQDPRANLVATLDATEQLPFAARLRCPRTTRGWSSAATTCSGWSGAGRSSRGEWTGRPGDLA